ncbi:MAG: GNAT family N-acetyltransferase [Pseudorhodobacter sp.]|nr:GNAT family N-acetyltransferase [Pseudorhodobacter sp.]
MTLTITTATAADEAEWHDLWAQYLAFYRITLAPEVTAHTWARILDPASPLTARVARRGGVLVGFALHHHHASTWVLGDDCYLEDLFVTEAARGGGVGRALIEDLMALARARGWNRLYWHTDEGNLTARRLYDHFTLPDGHIRYRLTL